MKSKTQENKFSLTDFYLSYVDNLYTNPIIRKYITLYHSSYLKNSNKFSEKEIFEKVLINLLEEAELALSLIKDINFTKNDLLLEVGAGFGFLYGFLKKQGYNIYGIEPASYPGFDGYFNTAIQIFKILNVDDSNFFPYSAAECTKLNMQFDIIFSNNVLEHIVELEQSFSSMKRVLKPDGLMIHNTVNYFVPYEPHCKIIIVPFYPKLTELFKPSLKKSTTWNSLNFITTYKLNKICKSENLLINYKKNRLKNTFLRLDSDPGFSVRQRFFIPIYKILKLTRLINFLDKIPIAITSPITFIIRKK